MPSESRNETVSKLIGTTPFTFHLKPGMKLEIREVGAASKARPSVGKTFRQRSFLVFKGVTKVGKLSDSCIDQLDGVIPVTCTVQSIDVEKQAVFVLINK